VAEGGLLTAIAECCLAGGVGAELEIDGDPAALFGESPGGGFVVSGAREAIDRMAERTPVTTLGSVGGSSLRTTGFEVSLEELRSAAGSLGAVFS
jgi:phosphoribosylformylglycinamidine synthase subunit PurL